MALKLSPIRTAKTGGIGTEPKGNEVNQAEFGNSPAWLQPLPKRLRDPALFQNMFRSRGN